jgi:hypothetical protein
VIKERKVMVKRKRQILILDGEPLSLSRMHLLQTQIFNMLASKIEQQETPSVNVDDWERIGKKDVIEEVEEVQQDFRKFRVWTPVVDFGWEGRNIENVPMHGITLGKKFAQSSGLVHLPQTYDLQTKDGVRATHRVARRTHDFNNSESFFFVREDILRTYLKKHNLAMVWAVSGERELSYKQMERARPDGDLAGLSHGDFQTIIKFK